MSQIQDLKSCFEDGKIVSEFSFRIWIGGVNFQRTRDDLSKIYPLMFRWAPNSDHKGKHKEWKKRETPLPEGWEI